MGLFGYYALRSVKNQLKKLCKTWVLIFLVACMAIGGLVGFGAAMLEDAGEDSSQTQLPEDVPPVDAETPPEELPPPTQEEIEDIVGLFSGVILLAVFVIIVLGAEKNGSKIFLPADVNLLFASPLSPQTVLLFRLMTQMGVVLMSSLYLLFQIPNLVSNLGLSLWMVLGLMGAWMLALAVAKLLQIFVYVFASNRGSLKKNLRYWLFGILGVVAVGFFAYQAATEQELLPAAMAFFNHPVAGFIPFWGWLKTFCVAVVAGDIPLMVLTAAATVLGCGLMAVIIWRMPADFYEDAMAKSEETAQLLDSVQGDKAVGFAKRKKDRSERLRRDGLNRGWGANMFFWRPVYNRFRFATLKIFTKTSITYLLAALVAGFFSSFEALAIGLILGALVFFRSMGNPLAEDTEKSFFRMIPEITGKKLWYSLLGGSACCLLDLLPALMVSAVLGADVLQLLGWAVLILSVDFYGTSVGAFIGFSVPVAAGKTIKTVVQIMFIYFGLLPDIILMALGLTFGWSSLAALLCGVVNFGLGGLFMALTPLFLDPRDRAPRQSLAFTAEDRKRSRRAFSRLGWACVLILVVTSLLQVVAMKLLPQADWTIWMASFAPLYLIGVPSGLLLMRRMPVAVPEKKPFRPVQLVKLVFISLFAMYGGNYLATFLTMLLSQGVPGNTDPGVLELLQGNNWGLQILVMVILAPIVEEFLFRKTLIDRMRPYGEKLAVVMSAVMFGVFHGNLTQFIYTTALGLVLGYVYNHTGKLGYCIGIHMLVNFLGGIVSGWLLSNLDLNGLDDPALLEELVSSSAFVVYVLFILFVLVSMLVGMVIFFRSLRKLQFARKDGDVPGKKSLGVIFGNPGMVVFFAVGLASIVAAWFVTG